MEAKIILFVRQLAPNPVDSKGREIKDFYETFAERQLRAYKAFCNTKDSDRDRTLVQLAIAVMNAEIPHRKGNRRFAVKNEKDRWAAFHKVASGEIVLKK